MSNHTYILPEAEGGRRRPRARARARLLFSSAVRACVCRASVAQKKGPRRAARPFTAGDIFVLRAEPTGRRLEEKIRFSARFPVPRRVGRLYPLNRDSAARDNS